MCTNLKSKDTLLSVHTHKRFQTGALTSKKKLLKQVLDT